MKHFKVKNRITKSITVMSEKTFKSLESNKNFQMDSGEFKKEKGENDEEVLTPIKVSIFVKVEEVDKNGHNKKQAHAHSESEKKATAHKEKFKK